MIQSIHNNITDVSRPAVIHIVRKIIEVEKVGQEVITES